MVSYDAYKNRIQKIAAVKNFIVKFRALFIVLALLLIGGISALLAIKGMVTANLIVPAQVVYGDFYEVEGGSALMSSVQYEFSRAGSNDWSSEKPTKAGKYLARIVTNKSFGKGHGAAVPFEIKPRPAEFTIYSDSVVYGSDPVSYNIELVSGDRLDKSTLVFDYDGFDGFETYVSVNARSLQILTADGEIVTECYEISAPAKQITFEKKGVTIAPQQLNYTYSGDFVPYESEVKKILEASLVSGDSAQFDTELVSAARTVSEGDAPLRPGTYTVLVTPRQLFKGETDVTHLYETEPFTVTIVISRRGITVTTGSAQQIYDADPLVCRGDYTADGLISGHTLEQIGDEISLVNAGSIRNSYSYRIFDGDGDEVSDCYEITVIDGTLTVLPRPLTVSSESESWIYDGVSHSMSDNYGLGGLLVERGHEAEVVGSANIIFVGTVPNALELAIHDENGNPITQNYKIIGEWGTLEITPRAVTIRTGSAEKVYDGEALTCATAASALGLALNETERADRLFGLVNAGTADNETTYRIFAGNTETTRNYTITYEYGTLTVKQREITVTVESGEWVYDGYNHSKCSATAENIVNGHEIEPTGALVTIIGVGTVENKYVAFRIMSGGEEVTDNYKILSVASGTLKVTPRPLTVWTGTSIYAEYDGTPLTFTDGWYAPNLADGQTLRVDTSKPIASVTDVSATAIDNVVYYVVVDGAGSDVTTNYAAIDYVWGKLNRTPFEVTLTTATKSWVYDGTAHSSTEYTVNRFTDLGHEIVPDGSFTPASVTYVADGVKPNEVHYTVLDASGKTVSHNYALTTVYGEISILARAVTITTGSAQKVYDGEALTNDKAQSVEGLADGERERADEVFGITDAEEKDNETTYKIYSGTSETTDNYQITYVYGKLKITPRAITIVTATDSWEYDGEAHSNATVVKQQNIVAGHTLAQITPLVTVTEVKDSGTENRYEYDVLDGSGRRVTDNYSITYEYGTLGITPRKITIATHDFSWVYDGAEHSYTDYTVTYTNGGGKSALVSGHGLVVTSSAKIRNVGTAVNNCAFAVRDGENNSVTENYAITYEYGTLQVTQREIEITTASGEWEYDGEVHFNMSATAENIVEGHVVQPTGTLVTITDAGTVDNAYTAFRIMSGAEEVTENYKIVSVTYGTLKVTPRELAIVTSSATKVYDGTPLTGDAAGVHRLVAGHSLAYDESRRDEFASVTNVYEGEVENKIYFLVKDQNGKDVTSNYYINYTWGTLTITPYQLTVYTASVYKVYDGTPLQRLDGFSADWLFEGHELVLDESRASEFASITNVFDALTVEGGKIINYMGRIPNQLYFKVSSQDDGRANENYAVANYELGTLGIHARPLHVDSATAEKEYDGTPLYGDGEPTIRPISFSAYGLLDGHRLEVDQDTVTQITDAGEVDNETEYKVFAGTQDVSLNYCIIRYFGKLTITPRVIEITTASIEQEYIGYPVSLFFAEEIYHVSSGGKESALVLNHMLQAVEWTEILNVGKVENILVCKVVDPTDLTNETVNNNYLIQKYNYGTLEITPRVMTVTTGSGSREYDGTPYAYPEGGSADRLLDLHTLVPDASRGYASVTNVYDGTVENEVYYLVYDENGEDVTSNYDISYEWGEIWVTPYQLTVYTGSASKYYDGKPLQKLNGFSADWLFEGHELVLDESRASEFASITNVFDGDITYPYLGTPTLAVGVMPNQLYFIVQSATDQRANENYEVAHEELGTLKITAKPTTTRGGSAEKEYDGTPLYGDSVDPVISGILEGHTLVADRVAQITDVVWTEDGEVGYALNTTTFKVFDGETDISLNYYFYLIERYSNTLGKLTITPRSVTVTTGTSLDREYDGIPYSYAIADADNLVENHVLGVKLNGTASVTDVLPEAIDNVVYCVVYDADRNDVTANYLIDYVWGKLNRAPRKIVVNTGSGTHEYDDEPFSDTAGITADRLLTQFGHTLAADESKPIASITEVGTAENVFSCIVLDSGGKDISYNYEITDYGYGTLTVTPREITVYTADHEWVYDGAEHSALGFVADRLLSGHELVAVSYPKILNAGSLENAVEYEVYKGTVNVTWNYKITYDYGTLIVTPREITVTLHSTQSVTYGDPIAEYASGAGNYLLVSGKGLATGEELEVAVYYTDENANRVTPENAGVYYVVIDTEHSLIHKNGDTFDTANYTITQVESKFSVAKRIITVKAIYKDGVSGKVYDGAAYLHPQDGYELTGNQMAYGETLLLGVRYAVAGSVQFIDGYVDAPVNAGTYFIVPDENTSTAGGQPLTLNYEMQYVMATYTITPRELTVALDDVTREYNGKQFDYIGEKYVVHVQGLVKGTLNAVVDCDGLVVGTYAVTFDTESWSLEGDLVSNYKLVSVTNSTVEITKRKITVGIPSLQLEYRGEVIPDSDVPYSSKGTQGGEGFVNGDDLNAVPVYTFTQNGIAVEPKERGIYTVAITFAGNAFIDDNYDITYENGTLEIVMRFVTVVVNPVSGFEYDGTAFDTSKLSFSHYHTTDPNEAGFLGGDEAHYDVTYTVSNYTEGSTICAGTYRVTVQLTPKEGYDDGYVISYLATSFTVRKRQVYAVPDSYTMEYNKQSPDLNAVLNAPDYYRPDGAVTFVNNDYAYVSVSYLVRNAQGALVTPVNAGDYKIYVSSLGSGFIAANYELVTQASDYGALKIERKLLIVAPVNQSVIFTGKPLYLASDSFTLLGGTSLVEGDSLTVVGDDYLDGTQARTNVYIGSYSITDGYSDMNGNYRVICSYEENEDELAELGIRAAAFRATLSYTKRTVKILQIPPEEYKKIVYNGDSVYIEFEIVYNGDRVYIEFEGDGLYLFSEYKTLAESGLGATVSEEAYGLLSGHSLAVVSAYTSSGIGVNKKWLKFAVYDDSGNDYSWAYTISYDDDPASFITVSPISVNVTVTAENYEEGDILAESDYELTEGALLEGDYLEICVENGSLVGKVYQLRENGERKYVTENYNVQIK